MSESVNPLSYLGCDAMTLHKNKDRKTTIDKQQKTISTQLELSDPFFEYEHGPIFILPLFDGVHCNLVY